MSFPTKAGEKFFTNFSSEIYTVKSFYGESGVEYPTYQEALDANSDKVICVKNVEYDGHSLLKDCTLI